MPGGELSAVFKSLASDAEQAGGNISKSIAEMTDKTAAIEESNVSRTIEAEERNATAFSKIAEDRTAIPATPSGGTGTAFGGSSGSTIANRLNPPKGPVKPLDVGTYQDLKKIEQVGDDLEHDHIPSAAALKKEAERRKGGPLTPAERARIHQQGTAIEVPKSVHAKSDTFRSRNTPTQINADAADLSAAAERDYTRTRINLIAHGYPPNDVDAALAKMRAMNRKKGI
jgi:hypothetical protein